MTKQQGVEVPVSGFLEGEIDFSLLFDRLTQTTRELILLEIVDPLVEAESDPTAGRNCVVNVVGHADRYDVEGATPEERRAVELQNSQLRAESTAAWLLAQLTDRLQSADLTQPADWASALTIDCWTIACGAADLVYTTPMDESERQENRRVVLQLSLFAP
jgi:hypothetical protein